MPSHGSSDLEIIGLGPGDPRLTAVLVVMRHLRDLRDPSELARLYAQGHADSGYRLVALFEGGACRAAAGYRLLTNFSLGRHLYVDDLVTAPAERSKGHGARLLSRLEQIARDAGCGHLTLDSGVHRSDAHRFYFRQGMAINAFHFAIELD